MIDELEAHAPVNPGVVNVQRYDRTLDIFSLYNGVVGTTFSIIPGAGYKVQVNP